MNKGREAKALRRAKLEALKEALAKGHRRVLRVAAGAGV